MINSTKLLLFASSFFKLLSAYSAPRYEPDLKQGQKQDFDYDNKIRKFLQNKEVFRVQMLNVTKYLYESHLIVCKLIMTKIQQRGIDLESNKWYQNLVKLCYYNFEINHKNRDHVGVNMFR